MNTYETNISGLPSAFPFPCVNDHEILSGIAIRITDGDTELMPGSVPHDEEAHMFEAPGPDVLELAN